MVHATRLPCTRLPGQNAKWEPGATCTMPTDPVLSVNEKQGGALVFFFLGVWLLSCIQYIVERIVKDFN